MQKLPNYHQTMKWNITRSALRIPDIGTVIELQGRTVQIVCIAGLVNAVREARQCVVCYILAEMYLILLKCFI